MAYKNHVRIAEALTEVKNSARDHIVRTGDISRANKELLCKTKWLREVIKGYYLLTRTFHTES